jgi:type VI secretion system protein VasG
VSRNRQRETHGKSSHPVATSEPLLCPCDGRAASLCQTRAHAEILPEHWLLKLLEQGEGDLTVLARRYEWDMDASGRICWAGWINSRARCATARSSLMHPDADAGSLADCLLNGEEHIRSVHLLMALVEKQNWRAVTACGRC